jgi:uncharacterized protein (TIGR01619 family)
MKIPMLILIALCFLLPITLPAQEAQWETYMGQYEKGPGSTILNMSIKNIAPVKDLPFLLVTGITFEKCTADGLPEQEAFPQLYKVSEAVKLSVDSAVINIFAGAFTYQCERLNYYYIKDTAGIRKKLNKLYADSFPGSKFYTNIKVDKIWQAYLDFLFPNALSLEFMLNEKLLLKLKEAGDHLDKERPVNHLIYFTSEADEQCFIPYVLKQHFKIAAKEKTDDLKHPFKLQISRTDKVDLSTISAITIDLKRMAMKCNGEYDGWETAVVK